MFRLTPYRRNNLVTRTSDFADLYSIFDDVWNDSFFSNASIGNGSFKVDIKDNEDAFVLEAELPGVDKKDITVDYKDGLLAIKVDRNDSKEDEKSNYIYKERRSASLQRVFRMKGVKKEDLKAKLENGVLTIVAPKLEEVINSYKVEIE